MRRTANLTAWERWELASFEADAALAPPSREESPPPSEKSPAPMDRAEIERICAEAREDGYQAGFHAGYQDGVKNGYEAGQAAVRAEAERLRQAADDLDQALKEFDQQVADELVALAIEIARQVVRHEVATRPETLVGVVSEALAQLPHQHAAIHLNPEDAALVRASIGEALSHAGHRIFEAPHLKPGSCLLEAGGSQIDASLATRWRRVIEALGNDVPWEIKD
ncbi:MAG: flagellar assembly protein FliH [Hyphomicrobiales bacterium]|jgi:flagellar assembly protein FliH|nr:flagellar assembly protein FliH [Hyphomicrobiales bacterium]NWG31740.1 flagellar assembly protein FliH [Rhodocyclaceae bacterium]